MFGVGLLLQWLLLNLVSEQTNSSLLLTDAEELGQQQRWRTELLAGCVC